MKKVLRKTARGVITKVSLASAFAALRRDGESLSIWRLVLAGGEIVLSDGTRYRQAEPEGSPPRPGWCCNCWRDPCACGGTGGELK
jgi:hypothetical protein